MRSVGACYTVTTMAKGNKKSGNKQQPKSPPPPQHVNQVDTSEDAVEEIRRLKSQVEKLTKRVEQLEAFKIVSSKVNEELRKEVDRLDQYGRRHNIIIRNVEKPAKETQEQLEAKVNTMISTTLKSPNLIKDVDKLHRIGRKRTEGRKTFQNIVVRFKSHSSRYALYQKKKDLKNNVKMNAHLTNHRAKTLHESIDFVKDVEGVEYTFSNIHGDLYVRLTPENPSDEQNDRRSDDHLFNSIDELTQILMEKGLLEAVDE